MDDDLLIENLKIIDHQKDAFLLPANIKKDVVVLGVTGTLESNLTNAEYAEANADVNDILENTTVPSGTISITVNGTHDVTNYVSANVNVDRNLHEFFETTLGNNKGASTLIKTIPSDTIVSPNMNNAFYNLPNLIEMPLLDTSEVTSMSSVFNGCTKLVSAPAFDTHNVTNLNNAFSSCSKLQNMPEWRVDNLLNMISAFSSCPLLTADSLNNILAMCSKVTSAFIGTKTLKTIGLSSTQADTCVGLSNWSAAQANGWTTGY